MKILAIRGKNLASLDGEFEIDFTIEPLKSAGIFAITGSTGAGKSTLLDALCLALFDDTPRANKAGENIQIRDVQDKTINQKDSRNILRRGSSEAYAEADFIALNGEEYRSKWMVRRARGRADGALQNTEIRLENLSKNTEEQGTKTELLLKIIELIGLNFDQFTRAVLLAQGDFATFLKAKQNEKAELLEKLTGTEIYSQISKTIYQNTKEAEQDLKLLTERIKDIKPLNEEELERFYLEKEKLNAEQLPLKNSLSNIEKKQNWIKQETQFKQDLLDIEKEAKKAQSSIEEAQPRFQYISLVDIAQEIRDTYFDLIKKVEVTEAHTTKLSSQEKDAIILHQKLKDAVLKLEHTKATLEDYEKRFELIKPDIAKAKELDIRIQPAKEKALEIQKDFDLQVELKTTSEKEIEKLQDLLKFSNETFKTLADWFETNSDYKEIIPKVDLILNFLVDASASKKQIELNNRNLTANNSILKILQEELKKEEKEFEELNQLLPTEILNLREKLIEGAPCPICGSEHHPLKDVTFESSTQLAEKELEERKTKLKNAIEQSKENIDRSKNETTRLTTSVQNYQAQYDNAYLNVTTYLQNLSDWKEVFDNGDLRNKLTEIANQWKQNKEKLDISTKEIQTIDIKLETEKKSLDGIKVEFERRAIQLKTVKTELEKLINQRTELLKGKKVEEVEETYTNLKNKHTEQYETLRLLKDKLEADNAKASGMITQMKEDIEKQTAQIKVLDESVKNWISNDKHSITAELLDGLMSKSTEWIRQEKEVLNNLNNRQLTSDTRLKERKNRLDKHLEAEDNPGEEQNKEVLNQLFVDTEKRIAESNKNLTTIEVALSNHKAAKEQMLAFEKELKKKEAYWENWQKLNMLLGSADGGKFKTIAQGYTLDVLLGYANKHLEELTKRYKLEKITDTLALQVIDNDMLGEIRSVHSLSGGESFLISLSLALGLSSLSSNRMKIESLFIDEGFGSLDMDTLSIAMDALENLQTQGRKIGVISHVTEMTERIATRIHVIKTANGKSQVKIIG